MLNSFAIGSGPPLLMIHGIMSDSSFFKEIAERLSDQFLVITYDRRGYGGSIKEQYDDYSVGIQAEDAVEVLNRHSLEPGFILGNSAGGLISMEIGMRYPERVRSMALMEPSLGLTLEDRKKLLAWNKELNGYVAANRPKRALSAFIKMVGGHSGKTKITDVACLQQTYRNVYSFLYGELNEVQKYFPTIEKCRGLSMPVHILISDAGRESIFATSSMRAAKILGWEITYVRGYHNAVRDEPEDFSRWIRKLFV